MASQPEAATKSLVEKLHDWGCKSTFLPFFYSLVLFFCFFVLVIPLGSIVFYIPPVALPRVFTSCEAEFCP